MGYKDKLDKIFHNPLVFNRDMARYHFWRTGVVAWMKIFTDYSFLICTLEVGRKKQEKNVWTKRRDSQG